MAKSIRLIKSFYRLLLPVAVLLILSVCAASVWLVHETAHPVAAAYVVTPKVYGMLSARGAQVTDETWTNKDGTPARGWLLRGAQNAPAVILLHKYGSNRSYVLNLGVKLNEATNFTILMPDQRGHGQEPAVKYTSFGGCEADDTLAAITYLRTLKTPEQFPLVGKDVGLYGLEMGSLAAISAATSDDSVKALALDSVPSSADSMLASTVEHRFPFGSVVTSKFAQLGTHPYFFEGCFKRELTCDMAKTLAGRKVLLLGGLDAPSFQESTSKLSKCFPSNSSVEAKTDLSPSGYSIINASLELSESYDQRVIDFFRQSLGQPAT
ncbi:MAG TPA: alpha/beta fold hydrolase [Pyrinomonadaceae bacterium]|nr:alpha/beta fold hydrolase [Pyrinomonadaceae bacterium]